MTTIAGANVGLSAAYAYAGGLVKTLATVTKLACTAIGAALKFIAEQAAQDGGRGRDAGDRLGDRCRDGVPGHRGVVSHVRTIYSILETIESAIQDFVQAKTAILDKYALIEDLVQGAATSAVAS